MKTLRSKLTYANVMATVAVFIALGGASYAATQLPKNSVGPKQLKKKAVTTAKIKDEAVTAAKVKKGTLTGSEINSSTLGTVPNASHAGSADNAEALGGAAAGSYAKRQLEAVHLVGKPGEPAFETGVSNTSSVTSEAGFFKDNFGLVHLQGTVNAATGKLLFTLPPSFRPLDQICFAVPAFVGGLTFKVNRVCVRADGNIYNDRGEGTEYLGLDGFSFPAAG